MYPVRIFLRSPSQMTEIPIHLGYPDRSGLVAAVSVWRAPAGWELCQGSGGGVGRGAESGGCGAGCAYRR